MTYTGQLVTGSVVLVMYLMIVLFAASNYIRRANHGWLVAHEAAFRGRIRARARNVNGNEPTEIDTAFRYLLQEPKSTTSRSLLSPSQWIGFCEIARWVRLHEAQRLEIMLLSDSAIQARFARAMGQVEELPALRQSAWQRRWVDLQKTPSTTGPSDSETAAMWREELSQLLAELFNARDSTYNQLVSLYGKAGWLVIAAYVPVAALLVAGYGPVLLAGFMGGLISRMQRLVYGQGRPTAYGASWVPLFLAPLLGALAAWAGLHLLALMQGLSIVNLENVLPKGSEFRLSVHAPVLGIAVLLGFSERLFNQLGDQADKVLLGERDTSSPAVAGSPSSLPEPLSTPRQHEPTRAVAAPSQRGSSSQAFASAAREQPPGVTNGNGRRRTEPRKTAG